MQERYLKLLFILSLGFLLTIAAALTIGKDSPFGVYLHDLRDVAYSYLYADKYENAGDIDPFDILRAASIKQSKGALEGYNLVVIRYQHSAQLLDMAGKIVHSWNLPFTLAFPDASHISKKLHDNRVHFRTPTLYPNGDLLVSYEAVGATPYGYGLVKMDKDSNVIWSYAGNVHHNHYVDRHNGDIYALEHRFVSNKLTDDIVILGADGKPKDTIDIADAFRGTPFKELLNFRTEHSLSWDSMHTNSIAKLEPEISEMFPMFKTGDILLSIRNLDLLAVIDPATKKVTWAKHGVWKAQHSVSFLNDGRLLLFDNRGAETEDSVISRVAEIDPASGSIAWSYEGIPPLASYAYGYSQRLENDNTLITDSLQMRAIEITPEGSTAWSLQLPERYKKLDKRAAPFDGTKPLVGPIRKDMQSDMERQGPNYNLVSALISVQRFAPEQLPFLSLTLQ